MKKPPLKIISYFFPHVSVSADPQFQPSDDDYTAHPDVKVGVEHERDDGLYQVALEITLEPESEKNNQPYSVHLVCIGIFSVYPKWPDPEKLLRITGASILYSAAREFLITITARGPWDMVTLPAVSFFESPEKQPTESD